MSKIIGIDLGTTNSVVATVDSGIPLVIADVEGKRLTPSVVHFPGAGDAPLVGHAANRVRVLKPAQTVYSIKRFIGRRGTDVPAEEMLVTYPVKGNGPGSVAVNIHETNWSPEEISAEILKKLKNDAQAFLGEPVSRAVITVPAYFNDAQRNATKRAGELAGFTVERIINEPTAAALAYGLDKLKNKARIAVYDLGGGTFDLSILELNQGIFQVLSTSGNTRLGGDDIDRRLVDFLIGKIGGKIEVLNRYTAVLLKDSNEASSPSGSTIQSFDDPALLSILSRLREAAEQAKIRLSSETETEISLPFLTPDFSFSYCLTREELDRLSLEVIQRTRTHCQRSLADAKLEPQDLDQVILVGGQTRMPLVRRLVSEWFGCAEFEETRGDIRLGDEYHRRNGPTLNTSQNPDEAVALGAAIQAAILSGDFTNMLLLDVTPLSLGIETFGGLMNVIIPRNTTIPVKAGEMFTTAVDNQREMLIQVLQGERERAKDNWRLGQFTLEFEQASRGVPRVGIQFEIDANGILHVLARDTQTGRQKIVEMKSAVDVDDDKVQKMVEESVEHAFEDLHARQWIEASLRARETLAAAQKGLEDCREELDVGLVEQINSALREIEDSLATEKADHQSGDLKRLKAAIARVDEITQPLAELMMDKVMESMLRKRGLLK